jgi:hypothetical protein
MANLYNSKPGSLVKTTIASPTFMTIDGLDLRSNKLVVTSFKLDRGQDVQHQKTLSSEIYTYAFGESIGRIQVGGLLFFGSCDGISAESVTKINSFYSSNNLYTKNGPTKVAIGSGNAFQCYLENLSIVADASPYNMGSFNLGFSVIPKKGR